MEINEIKKLGPGERLRKLKEIEEEKKKEIQEAEELIRESEREINEEVEFRRKVPIDEVRAESADQLEGIASQEAKNIWKTSRELGTVETRGTAGAVSLEATVEASRTAKPREEETRTEYGRAIEGAKREQEEVLYQRQKAEEGESPAEKYSKMERPGEVKEENIAQSYKRKRKEEEY